MMNNTTISDDLLDIINNPIRWSEFSQKTILISGANGFLPAYIVETLLLLLKKNIIKGTKILALVRNIDKAKARFENYLENDNLQFIIQDVSDPIDIECNVDFIIHAASQASPKYYGTDPVGTLSANTLGTINLLKFAQKNSIESFLYFSSSEVYGILDEAKIPTKESDYGYIDPTNVRSCYAESKRMGETICVSWLKQYNIPVKIVRPFHTYGPGMALDDGRVYADFIADIVNNRDIVMQSDGSAMRSFCYLADATIAFFLVLLNGVNGEAYNVGNSDCEISILNLANKLVSLFPEKGVKVVTKNTQNMNYLKSAVSRNCPDMTKINNLGWYPKTKINEGFHKTINSYEKIL
jgi:nucleoside-diphosphate-sugar epimerase